MTQKPRKISLFLKSHSIELGEIPTPPDIKGEVFQLRRRSHADMESVRQFNEMGIENTSLPTSLKSMNCSKVSLPEVSPSRETSSQNGCCEQTTITQDTLDRLREVELEDILMNARNITEPDPTANMSFCPQPAKVLEGTFRHSVAVREVDSKTGAFRHRTIEVLRNSEDELGISVRKGDGWEKDTGIFVSRINLGSIYDKFELMKVGDEIVKVNRIDIRNMDVDSVVRLMHIPEKLSLTIKILTPFSKKRVSKSTIANIQSNSKTPNNKFKNQSDSKTTHASNYKIAQMKIGMSTENVKKLADSRESKKTEQEAKDQAKKDDVAGQKAGASQTGRSPYRVGATQRQLSPIRETASEEKMNKCPSTVHVSQTRRTSVTWLDQRINNGIGLKKKV